MASSDTCKNKSHSMAHKISRFRYDTNSAIMSWIIILKSYYHVEKIRIIDSPRYIVFLRFNIAIKLWKIQSNVSRRNSNFLKVESSIKYFICARLSWIGMKMENMHFHACVCVSLSKQNLLTFIFLVYGSFCRCAAYELDFFASPASWKHIDAELMQKRFLVGFGPSLNTCPRCAPQLEHVTSVRTISLEVSLVNLTRPCSKTSLNAGQPHPLSYLVSDENNSWSHTMQVYVPLS